MVEEELQQLEFAFGQRQLAALVPDHAALRIQPEPVKFPEPSVPKIQSLLVSVHLSFYDPDVGRGRLLGRGAGALPGLGSPGSGVLV